MAEETKVKRIDQVRNMIKEGIYTKQEIADALGIKPGGVSSQMTYLRWQQNFIAMDENKCLHFVTEEEHEALEVERLAKVGSKKAVSKKTPAEQSVATAKTIATQTKQKDNWAAKAAEYNVDLENGNEDDIEDIDDLIAEAEANVTLLTIKIKRNVAKAAELPDLEEAKAEIASLTEAEASEGDDEEITEDVEGEELLEESDDLL